MTTNYSVKGMTCNGCRTTVETILNKINGVEKATVFLETEIAEVESKFEIDFNTIIVAMAEKPKFTITKTKTEVVKKEVSNEITKSWFSTYYPLLLIVGFISGISAIISFKNGVLNWMQWINSFMAGFFIVFSFFKLLNLKGFAASYAMYDVIAKKIPIYGYIYPFIELLLGIMYLVNYNPFFTNTVTLVVMSLSIIGVIESNINKRKIKCACLGDVFNLPMSTVTIIEDGIMITMTVFMLFESM